MSQLLGYARVSTTDQGLDIQEAALRAYADGLKQPIKLFSEKKSGTTTKGRDELARLLDYARDGDTIVCTRIDRLARSLMDLEVIANTLRYKGIHLKATEQSVDTSTPEGMAFFQMLGVFAQFETAIRRERQLEGIAAAKADGRYKGRTATIDAERIKQLVAEGKGATEIAKQLKIGRASVYRYLKETDGVAGI
ncbi:helix-turn-helix domain-containing protein [Rhizobiales bacterium RZME27]|uniref:Helix-turn-helix domain-containing protein n=1 Tax=Endobacterium cereale TaxID=2663029 RepID=A0A6A8AJL1_9HYPH|nr:recombinase family protein [Endobacterium cereale]MQY50078.1 helix-turn-helix domain-containing protein [Endobacterium cereale]